MFVKMGFRQLCFGRDFSEQFYSQCPINSILPDIKDIPSETSLDFIHFPAEQQTNQVLENLLETNNKLAK